MNNTERSIKALEARLEILMELLEQNGAFDRKEYEKFVGINQRMADKSFLETCYNPKIYEEDE